MLDFIELTTIQKYIVALFFERWIHALNIKRINSQIPNQIVTHKSSIQKMLSQVVQDVSDQIADIENDWSYLKYNNIHIADVSLVKYKPQTGSSWIQTPPHMQKKSCVNVKYQDQECFKYAILSVFVSSRMQSSTSKSLYKVFQYS